MLTPNSYFKMFSASSNTKGLRCPYRLLSYYNSYTALKESTEERTHYNNHDYLTEVEHWTQGPKDRFCNWQHGMGTGCELWPGHSQPHRGLPLFKIQSAQYICVCSLVGRSKSKHCDTDFLKMYFLIYSLRIHPRLQRLLVKFIPLSSPPFPVTSQLHVLIIYLHINQAVYWCGGAGMRLGRGPTMGAWATYPWLQAWRKLTHAPHEAINCQ